jgi:DNA-binding response OmpR family regulator
MSAVPEAQAPRALILDADPALLGLLEEWLLGEGCTLAQNGAGRPDFIVVDVPFPRDAGLETLQRTALDYPGVPLLVLSSGFFPGIDCNGAVARSLGAAAVLAKPLARETLLAVVRAVLHRA